VDFAIIVIHDANSHYLQKTLYSPIKLVQLNEFILQDSLF